MQDFAAPFAAGVFLAENPNRGKRHVGRLAFDGITARDGYRIPGQIGTGRPLAEGIVRQLEAAQSTARAPLTVKTPLRDSLGRRIGRGANTHSAYTV